MDKNHQDAAGNKLTATDNKLWIPPLSPKDQKQLKKQQKRQGQGQGQGLIKWFGLSDKTLWDWLQLLAVLAIPVAIAMGTAWFSYQQNQTSLQISERQHNNDQAIALDQQRETTLKTCLDDIRDLLLNKSLRASKPEDEVRVVARVEVLAALRQLDGERKGLLMDFLSEAGLITWNGNNVIIDLSVPTCAVPTCAVPTCAVPTCSMPTCAVPTCAVPTCAVPTWAVPT